MCQSRHGSTNALKRTALNQGTLLDHCNDTVISLMRGMMMLDVAVHVLAQVVEGC